LLIACAHRAPSTGRACQDLPTDIVPVDPKVLLGDLHAGLQLAQLPLAPVALVRAALAAGHTHQGISRLPD